MSDPELRPRWVGPSSIIFSIALALGALAAIGYSAWSLWPQGPSAEEIYFGKTLPHWWIATAKGKAPKRDALAEAPSEELRTSLEQIQELLQGSDPNAVAAESIALNQVIERAGLPYFIDVVVRGRWPLILSFAVAQRDTWKMGDKEQLVVVASRLDRTNVVTAFTGHKGEDLPVVLLDRIEASLLRILLKPSSQEVERLYRETLFTEAQKAVPGFDQEIVRKAVLAREKAIIRMEKYKKLKISRPRRFRLPYSWLEEMEELTKKGAILKSDLRQLKKADQALNEGPTGEGLLWLRRRMAEVGSAHQAHAAFSPPLEDAPAPEALVYIYGEEATSFRAGGHLHMRAALGAIRDSQAPACLALMRTLRGGAGKHRRATAWYYGTISALVELFQTRETSPNYLAQQAKNACAEGDSSLRAKAAQALEKLGVAKIDRLSEAIEAN